MVTHYYDGYINRLVIVC